MSADPTAVLDPAGREALGRVLELLAEERASVSSVVDERAWKVHVADSLTGLEVPELRAAERIADVGAGAGFPGLALAVALPDAQVDLIESIGRKCDFMRRAIDAAGIPNATVLNTRSEDLGVRRRPRVLRRRHRPRRRPPLDPGRARIPAPEAKWRPRRLEGQTRSRGGEPSSPTPRSTSQCAPKQILDVGNRAGSQHRHLHVIRKSGPTPPDLPRRPGMAKKRPKG